MIIYNKRKPKAFDGTNCIGVTGENLAETQEFLINGITDITADYRIHLRFADGSVNSIIPDSTTVDRLGTKIVWKVKKNDIFMHGYFELQLEGRGENGSIFQTQIVTLYADESIPIEDREYLNPNSETLRLREEMLKTLTEAKNQQAKIDENRKIIEQSNLSLKENISNKLENRQQIVNQSENYPSIKYLEAYYLPASKSYGRDELDGMFAAKADRATTLDGYGITDAYTKSETKTKLDQKLNKMPFDEKPKQESPCYLTSGTVYNALLAKADKASTLDGYGITDAYTKNAVDASLANKADKATTLDGYGITDTYTQSQIKTRLEEKLKKMPFDSEPTLNSPCYLTSGAVYNALLAKADKTALATKYDSSNVEVGKGELTPAQAIYDGFEGSFNYSKIGKTVTVALNITNLVAGKNYVRFAGLPFRAMAASKLSSIAVYTTNNKLVNLRLDDTWFYISSPGTTFAEGEKINVIVTYIIG